MFSDLTLGPSFKVKRWFTGFGELCFRWIQICIGSPMCRSSYICYNDDFKHWLHYKCMFWTIFIHMMEIIPLHMTVTKDQSVATTINYKLN